MIKDFYAVLYRKGKEISARHVGRYQLTDGCVTSANYDRMNRKGLKIFSKELKDSQTYFRIEMDDGKTTDFAGFPATGYMHKIRFIYRRAI